MPYVISENRYQFRMTSLDSLVSADSEARIIDAFVDALDLEKLGVKKPVPAREGRPAYHPRDMLKLYIYGYRNSIQSSRKLEKACHVNLEVRWLISEVKPDFRTIANFRKDNLSALKNVFYAFNRLTEGKIENEYLSVDGSKFFASNSKDRNFTLNKLDDRIKWLEDHTREYLRLLDEADKEEDDIHPGSLSKEELDAKLKEAEERLARYRSYRKKMEEENLSQISLTDPDSRLMKAQTGFGVAYNIQTAVSSETHMIADFNVTSEVTDYGQLTPTLIAYKQEHCPDGILEAVADKGYHSEQDMLECLESGIIPHVILPDGKDTYEIETPYEETKDCDPSSTKPEDLKKCLRAGIIPKAYEGIIESAVVTTQTVRESQEPTGHKTSPFSTTEEMKEKAAEGYFVRDAERNTVYCPGGSELRKSYVTKKGRIRYVNKHACQHCPYRNQCYKGKKGFKEVEFNKDEFVKPNGNWLRAENKEVHFHRTEYTYKTVQVVILTLRPDRTKMSQRMCLSEHPFGTIKRALNGGYFLLRGKQKVEGEFALKALAYNIRVAINHLGFDKLMELIRSNADAFYSVFKVLLQKRIRKVQYALC